MSARLRWISIVITSNLCLTGMQGVAQAGVSGQGRVAESMSGEGSTRRPGLAQVAGVNKVSPAGSVTPTPTPTPPVGSTRVRSLLDEPATAAKIQVAGDQLTINATNASLSEVIRQVAAATGMQVEGNSRDQRVFGTYGPGAPPDVLSTLLYDSGYNVVMVGSTADGAPRRLVLSTRSAGAASNAGAAAPQRSSDDDDEETPAEAPPAQPGPMMQSSPGTPPPAQPGQPRTPQQMLEELQRMHQGQQAPELPHE